MGPLLFSDKSMAICMSSTHFSISDRELKERQVSGFQTTAGHWASRSEARFPTYLAATMMDCRWPRRVRQWGTPHSSSLCSICGTSVHSVTAEKQARHSMHFQTFAKMATAWRTKLEKNHSCRSERKGKMHWLFLAEHINFSSTGESVAVSQDHNAMLSGRLYLPTRFTVH